jgi:hypothetical protein
MNSPEIHVLTRTEPTGGERPSGRVPMAAMAAEGGPLLTAMLARATTAGRAAGTAGVAAFGSSAR